MIQRFTKVFGLIIFSGLSSPLFSQTSDWSWAPAGPIYAAGRARNMIVDNTDASGKTLYVGSASAGIFESVDGGARWFPLDDQGSVKNISYLAQAHDGTIYAATGEGFLRIGQKAKAEAGTGLYKLVGNTLQLVESSATLGTVINRIVCHPTLPRMAVASDKGIFISQNGGAFSLAPGIPTGNLIVGMDVKFDAAGLLYCTVGNETGVITSAINTAAISSKVYKSTDTGLGSFTDITPISSYLTNSNYGRIELAIAPSDNNVVYVSCANKNTSIPGNLVPESPTLNGLFVTYNASASHPDWALVKQFSSQLDPSLSNGTLASADYAHVIFVHPTDPNQLYIGSYSLYRYTRNGGTNNSPVGLWEQLGQTDFSPRQDYLQNNIHDIKMIPGTPAKFYFITDAGIYRSLDMENSNDLAPATFQAFYKGLVTGQFNSVSIERFPLADNTEETKPGSKVKPYSGFIGGTNGNGLIYYSGKDTVVSQEKDYLSGEIYSAEYSRALNGAAFLSSANGNIYKTSNVRNTSPTLVSINSYTGALSKIAPVRAPISNTGFSSGAAFKLWENYGQKTISPDSALFYNDSARVMSAVLTYTDLTTKKEFTFSARRPNNNKAALIDSIVIRTSTVTIGGTPEQIPIPFTTGQSISISLPKTFSPGTATRTILSGSSLSVTGPASSVSQPSVTFNSVTLSDEISVTFNEAPFATRTQSSATINYPSYYSVSATIFYKYNVGDIVEAVDNSMSIKSFTYHTVLKKSLSWDYFKALTSYTLTAPVNTSIPNPTFVLTPGNIVQTNPSFVVEPITKTDYVISQKGSYDPILNPLPYAIFAIPVSPYLIVAVPNPAASPVSYVLTAGSGGMITNSIYNITPTVGVLSATQSSSPQFTVAPASPVNYTITKTDPNSPFVSYTYSNSVGGYTYVLNPGNIAQTATIFTVAPSALTTFTITQLGTTLASAPLSYSTIGTTSYVLNPGNISQPGTQFIVSPTISTTYTLSGVSSNTNSALSTETLITVAAPPYTISAIPLTVYAITAVPSSSAIPASHTLTATPNLAISNATYNISPSGLGASTGSSPEFTVAPTTPTNYTITQRGVGSPSVSYTYFNSVGGYTYVLNPGNVSQVNPVFTVNPNTQTNYSIIQLGTTSTIAPLTYSSIGSSTYILNPGNISQSTPVFAVTPTITTTYTLQTLSSNTVSAANSSTVFTFLSAKTSFTSIGTSTSVPFSPYNSIVKMPTTMSARLAFVLNDGANTIGKNAVVVAKNVLSLNDPLNIVRVSQSGCYSDDAQGNATHVTIDIPGKPIILEWSKSGTELYYATDDNKLYRVSHITDLFDLSSASYSGKFFTDVFTYPNNTLNSKSPYRTTLIGSFEKPVTSISISNDNKNLALTFNAAASGTTGIILYNTNDARTSDQTNINWISKGSSMTNSLSATYCSLMEKDNSKKIFIGTDHGVFYTDDITSDNWVNINSKTKTGQLPNVQVFDIDQQLMDPWDCYNSGQIYVATNGRGIWANNTFFKPYTVGVEEIKNNATTGKALDIYPNPANEKVTLHFTSYSEESEVMQLLDLSGRVVKSESLGKLNSGETTYTFDVSELNAGVYIVTIHGSSTNNRVAKLVVTK